MNSSRKKIASTALFAAAVLLVVVVLSALGVVCDPLPAAAGSAAAEPDAPRSFYLPVIAANGAPAATLRTEGSTDLPPAPEPPNRVSQHAYMPLVRR